MARRFVNVMVTAMVRLGIGGKTVYLLTTTGRKSGQPRTTPVTLVVDGADRWLVSPYGLVGWVHNIRATPQVSLRRGSTSEVLDAVEVDAEAAGPVLQRYVRAVPITAPYFDAKASDPVQQFVAEASRHPVFRLTARSAAGA
ncbi:MAG TPA: nitroreductase family deazaflavin-dependent oxidoreductase [Streptosporangiaceae bacterium]|nr:nitroreductase family deazaflavin-dependent oxidoreductase [Streptosporangiaceae bacterium]